MGEVNACDPDSELKTDMANVGKCDPVQGGRVGTLVRRRPGDASVAVPPGYGGFDWDEVWLVVSAFCGACTVHKNGDAIRACITPMSSLAGAARPGSVRVARSGEITAKSSVIGQSNFDSYPVARINEAHIRPNVYLVESDAPPAGVGGPGVPPFIPALCNAIYAATGKRS
jgi:hypothetical protein